MTCSICKNQQSRFINDYPLAKHLTEYRICAKCHDKLEAIQNDRSSKASKEYIQFFQDILDKEKPQRDVKEFITSLLSNEANFNETESSISEIYPQNTARQEEIDSIKISSGFNFEGYRITDYLDFISSETAMGLGYFKTLFASISNIRGTESKSLRKKLKSAKDAAMNDIKLQAYELGANAIIGLDLDYTMFGDTIVGVIISGTAVKIIQL